MNKVTEGKWCLLTFIFFQKKVMPFYFFKNKNQNKHNLKRVKYVFLTMMILRFALMTSCILFQPPTTTSTLMSLNMFLFSHFLCLKLDFFIPHFENLTSFHLLNNNFRLNVDVANRLASYCLLSVFLYFMWSNTIMSQ